MDSIENQIRALEHSTYTDEVRKNPAALDALFPDDFFEVASDGSIDYKQDIIEYLESEPVRKWVLEEYKIIPVSEDTWIYTYYLKCFDENGKELNHTFRSSTWKKSTTLWQLIYHQVSPVKA